jgi:hypothetical protein
MAIIKKGNYSMDKISNLAAVISNGDTVVDANLSQLMPNTTILAGFSGLTFVKCNLTNCTVPGDSVIDQCNETQIDRCYHLHPDWGLDVEVNNCAHVVKIDTITIDGNLISTEYHRKDTIQ